MSTPPGWYDDGSGTTRWWDGERWSDGPPTPGQAPEQSYGSYAAASGQGGYGQQGGYGEQGGFGQGGYGEQGGYGGPGGAADSPRRSGGGPLKLVIAAVVVLVLVGVATTVLVLTRGGDDEADADSPEAAVEDAVAAVFAVESCDDELPLVTGERLEVVEELVDLGDIGACEAAGDYTLDVTTRDVEVDGSSATAVAEVSATYDGSAEGFGDHERIIGLELEEVDGDWLVARRTVTGATPEDALAAYLEARTCREQREAVTGERADLIDEAIEDDTAPCTEPFPLAVTDSADVAQDDEEATDAELVAAIEVQAEAGTYDDELSATAEQGDLGWTVTSTLSEAARVAEVGIGWYVAPTCEEAISLSVDPIKAGLEQSIASPTSHCQHLDDYVYEEPENVLPEVDGDTGQVVFEIRGEYTGTDPNLRDIGARVTMGTVKVDGEWFVNEAGDAPLNG